jgi:hypothetical protein
LPSASANARLRSSARFSARAWSASSSSTGRSRRLRGAWRLRARV